ncbi:aspartate aminotransferase family protein [Saccharicrinis sp. FJH62]|uniref:class-III pyridoxal-phosphate-dependent aminotransferase n=1 Tax=Saccharicrinis sp. FJH62 TaxID=3344657 RepID=UPI0035D41F07
MKKDIIPFYSCSDKLIVKSKDCYLFDSDGKKYIDFESGVWCANIGHSNTQVIKRINTQIKESIHHGYHFRNNSAERLSLKLQQLIGFKNGANVFLSSGSEAVNLSITLARHFTGKKKILKINNSYLSAYGFGQISDENASIVNVRFNDSDSIHHIDFTDISALVVETGGASVEMIRFPDNEFMDELIRDCRKNSCLIIADEVTTGIGRLGKWFGFQYYDFIPDMVVAGKALGNGYPISSVTINSVLAGKFEQKPLRYAQSHQNDPLGCSVALEVIKIIETNNLIERSRETGDYFKQQLDQIKFRYPEKIKEVRARGLMLAIEFKESVNGELISRELFDYGMVIGYKLNTLRFLPPLIITNLDIDKLVRNLDKVLQKK